MAKYELDGRTAIVTGAGAGIGEACAHVLSSSDAAVLVVDLDEERAENVANSISNDGGTALSHVADVSKLDDVEAMVARAEEELGPPFSRKAARKIAAPLARKDGSHNAPSHQRV